jgi:hypothetical protein
MAALPPEKEPIVLIIWEAGWSPEPVCMLWRGENSVTPAGNRFLAVQPVAIQTELSRVLGISRADHNREVKYSDRF